MAKLSILPGNPIVASASPITLRAFYDDENGTVTDVTARASWSTATSTSLSYSWSSNVLTATWNNAPAGTVLLAGTVNASYTPSGGAEVSTTTSLYVLGAGTASSNVLVIVVLGVTYVVNTATNPWTIAPLGNNGTGARPSDIDVFVVNGTPATKVDITAYITCFLVNMGSLANTR